MIITRKLQSPFLMNEEGSVGGGGIGIASSVADPPASTPESTVPDPSVPPSFDAKGLFSPEGAFEKVGDRYANDDVSAEFIDRNFAGKTPTEVAKILKDNMTAARQKGVQYPNAEASDEDRAIWNKAAGVPEAVGQIMPEDFETFQNATGWTPEVTTPVLEAMINAGTPGPAIAAALEAVQKAAASQGEQWQAAAKEALETSQSAIRDDWGVEYDSKISSAQAAAERVGVKAGLTEDEISDLVSGVGEVRNPSITKAFAVLAETIQEAAYKGPASTSVAKEFMGPKEEAFDIMNNTSNPMYEKYRTSDKDVHDHVDRLLAKAAAS
jgi:hypothetical protein